MPFSIPNAEMRTAKRTARKEPSIFSVFLFSSRAYSRVMCRCALKMNSSQKRTLERRKALYTSFLFKYGAKEAENEDDC